MWIDILTGLALDIGEAICSDKFEEHEAEKFNKKLHTCIIERFKNFADSSLDCDDFAKLVKSRSFVEMLRDYFFTIHENVKKDEYLAKFVGYICSECPKANEIEVRRYIKEIEQIYIKFLYETIEKIPGLNAFFHYVRISHKEIIERNLESDSRLLNYLKHLDRTPMEITNNDILEYHRICQSDYGVVRFTGISGVDSKQAQDINQFYVENTFSIFRKGHAHEYQGRELADEFNESIGLKDFFNYNNKIVLIGAAGLGKSTTLNYLFCNYEEMYQQNIIKIKVDLKEYAKAIFEEKHTILWCLSQEFCRRIPKNSLTLDNIENLLANYLCLGECLVIFDALDEIPTQSVRSYIRDEIATFCNVYYLNRFIISTREVGYLKNQFDTNFIHIKINEFNDEQIKEYGCNWIKANYKNIDAESFWLAFDKEVERAKCRELIRNPIVLILALVIFDVAKSLPNKRVEFYKKCINTFLILREEQKGTLPEDVNFRNILGNDLVIPRIAHYKFKKFDSDMDTGFAQDELKNAILEAIEVPDKYNWFEATKLFSKYLIDRTELICEIDEDVLDFAHKTFYEYFLATYFARELDVEEIITLLDKWIGDSNYDELSRLIIEVIVEKNDVIQHKKIIEYLFEEINKSFYSKQQEKAINMFSIVVELYNNNMIQAKYQHYYYECILLNSRLLQTINQKSMRIGMNINVKYDVKIAVETYIRLLEENSENFYKTIESLRYLNHEFRNEVCKHYKQNVRFKYVSTLLVYNRNLLNEDKRKIKENIKSVKKYFLSKGRQILQNSPEVFLSVLDIAIHENNYEEISQMTNIVFDKNHQFCYYIIPYTLFELIYKCFDSAENFLVLLISLIICGRGDVNFYLEYVLKHIIEKPYIPHYKISDKKRILIFNNTIGLLQWFQERDFSVEYLIDKHIFDIKYSNMYEYLIKEYRNDEAGNRIIDIERYIKIWSKKSLSKNTAD